MQCVLFFSNEIDSTNFELKSLSMFQYSLNYHDKYIEKHYLCQKSIKCLVKRNML